MLLLSCLALETLTISDRLLTAATIYRRKKWASRQHELRNYPPSRTRLSTATNKICALITCTQSSAARSLISRHAPALAAISRSLDRRPIGYSRI